MENLILMHKDIPVAEVMVSLGKIMVIKEIFNYEHLPVGTRAKHDSVMVHAMNSWLKIRTIPNTRQNKEKIEEQIGCSLSEAAFKGMAVSLTDCYWFRTDERLSWKDVNYHDNGFSENLFNNIILGEDVEIDFKTPDFTTDGVLEKYWISINDTPTLLKFGEPKYNVGGVDILSANEIIAAQIAQMMDIPHANYYPIRIKNIDRTVCATPCLLSDPNIEFVNGGQIEKEGLWHEGVQLGKKLEAMGYGDFINKMKAFDFIILNPDRHDRNFAFARNADTLEFLSPVPLYDNGSCLAWNGEYNVNNLNFKSIERDMQKDISQINLRNITLPNAKEACEIIEKVYKKFGIPQENINIAKAAIKGSISILSAEKERQQNDIFSNKEVDINKSKEEISI